MGPSDGLTVATQIAIRQRGRPHPAAGFSKTPSVDHTSSAASNTTRAPADPMDTRDADAGTDSREDEREKC